MEMNKIIGGVLLILVLVSAVQTYQLSKLSATVKSGGGVVWAASAASVPSGGSSSAPSSGAALPSNLQNLPSQVGGC